MNNKVKFEEATFNTKQIKHKNSMADFLIVHGIVKNNQQAVMMLLVFAIIFFIATIFIVTFTVREKPLPYQPDPDSLLQVSN